MTPQIRWIVAARLAVIVLLGVLGLLAGCASTDPVESKETWHPNGTNEMNIAAQVADPADLARGREPTGGTDGEQATAAIVRLRTGHVKALPDSAISDLRIQQAPSSGSP